MTMNPIGRKLNVVDQMLIDEYLAKGKSVTKLEYGARTEDLGHGGFYGSRKKKQETKNNDDE
tara:strand:+ start:1765 stop:1950 length:186 start_codon:yes stop_codon:yes gene_type:complete